MKLIGALKEKVEKAETMEEKKRLIEEAGIELTDEEIEMVSGGEITSANVVGYGSSDPSFDKSLECMFGAPAIIK